MLDTDRFRSREWFPPGNLEIHLDEIVSRDHSYSNGRGIPSRIWNSITEIKIYRCWSDKSLNSESPLLTLEWVSHVILVLVMAPCRNFAPCNLEFLFSSAIFDDCIQFINTSSLNRSINSAWHFHFKIVCLWCDKKINIYVWVCICL